MLRAAAFDYLAIFTPASFEPPPLTPRPLITIATPP
jgi:hypothetical protein